MHKIDLRRIDLNLLVVFGVLMRERSVTRAAPTPFDPATSKRIFRVAFPDVTMAWFARLAAAVHRDGPDVRLEWVLRDERNALAVAEGSVDLACFPPPWPCRRESKRKLQANSGGPRSRGRDTRQNYDRGGLRGGTTGTSWSA